LKRLAAILIIARVAMAADAPPSQGVAPVPGDCLECASAHEGMPQRFESSARIVASSETGERLSLTGRTLAPDGLPRAGVILYAVQSDDRGIHRAWVRTDAGGLFTFDTFIPAATPEGARIHMIVIEPGRTAYRIDDFRFSQTADAGTIVLQRDLSTGRLYATHDIHLREHP